MIRRTKASSAGSTVAVLALVLLTLGLTAAPASAAPAAAVMGTVSEVSYASAHVTGEVDTEGYGFYSFQYSTDQVNWTDAVGNFSSANSLEGVSGNITGLKGGTKYFVRLLVNSCCGTTLATSAEPNPAFTTLPVDPPATVSVNAASNVTDSTAEVSGKVERPTNADPAFDVNCHFEYVSNTQFELTGFENASATACEPNPVTAPGESTVTAELTGLAFATNYHLRLTASNAGGSDSKVAPNFETETVVPLLSGTGVTETTSTSATLEAQVNPGGLDTTYHFEYLTLDEYEAAGEEFTDAASTPESASIGDDTEAHPATAAVEGLTSDTDYRFRVVATNAKSAPGGTGGPVRGFHTAPNAADACPNAAVRSQQGSIFLSDCRAYEMVSPLNKHGNFVNFGTMATADGDAIAYSGSGAMGAATRGVQSFSTSRRQADGWSTEPSVSVGESEDINVIEFGPANPLFSPDLRAVAFIASCCYVKDVPTGTLGLNPTLIFLSKADRSVEWLSRPEIPNSVPHQGESLVQFAEVDPVGGRPDLGIVYFWAYHTILPSDAARTEGESVRAWGMYEYSDGTLKSAGTLPDGSESPYGAAPANSGYERFGSGGNADAVGGNQVSSDGSTLFFISPDVNVGAPEPPQLYVRRNGHSILVSHAPDGTPAPSGVTPVTSAAPSFPGASPLLHVYGSEDGKTAIFQSTDALAPGAPNDSSLKAYRYDVEADTSTYLPGVGGGSIVAASEDLHRFLFASGGIKLWDEGTIKTISGSVGGILTPARATASGSVFVFTSSAAIPGFHAGGAQQIYRYDVAHDKLACVSCPPDDVTSPAGAAFASGHRRGMSADGERVFFDTADPLVPRDTNGVNDVYEWTPRRVSLISSGQSPAAAFFADNSANGNDVFFTTQENLDPEDNDRAYDIYDARVDGGFLKKVVVPCSGEACRSGASAPPGAATAATKSFEGAANQPQGKPKKSKRHKKKHHKKAHKRAAHKRGGAK